MDVGQGITRKLASIKDVIEITSLSRPTIYRAMKEGTFPRPVKIGKRRVAWPMDVLDKWMEECHV